MQKNTPELWDKLWKKTSESEDQYNLAREENGMRWQRIEKLIIKKFKTFRNLRVIEIGAGAGTNALLFAKNGAKITILDYSAKAIERSKEFFKRNNCKAKFILADALKLPEEIIGKYDVSMSFGLAEHFQGKERQDIIKSHISLLNKYGIAIISVPNKYNFPYRIYMAITKLFGMWNFGEEYPYSRNELKQICWNLKIDSIEFLSDSFWNSFRFINPFRKLMKKDISKIKKEKGSFWDQYLAYSLVLVINNSPTKKN
ncbi:MAG: methyltransferase domain-containing protein [Candidatus Pacearchaeota archaeon]